MKPILSFFAPKFDVSKVNVSRSLTVALACYMASSTAPLYAQSSGSQANTLLEVQALRQEVAQLRDMVERQQYELRKVQRSLQKNDGAAVNTQPLGVSGNTVSQQVSQSVVTSRLPLESNAPSNIVSSQSLSSVNLNNSVGSIDASVVPTKSGLNVVAPIQSGTTSTGSSNVITKPAVTTAGSTSQSSGRTYPPVVEIEVGGANPEPAPITAATVQSVVQADNPVTTSSTIVSQAVNQVGTQSVQPINDRLNTVVASSVDAGGISVVDIQPIETVSAGSIVSIPSTVVETTITSTVNEVVEAQPSFNVISENDYYQQGFGLLKESKHSEAVGIFQQQIKSYPKGDLADDAYYWIAESRYVNRKLDVSKENYKAIVQGYPNSDRLPDAMLKLAYIEQEQGNIIESRILLQEIMQFHPNSDAALLAKNRLSELN